MLCNFSKNYEKTADHAVSDVKRGTGGYHGHGDIGRNVGVLLQVGKGA